MIRLLEPPASAIEHDVNLATLARWAFAADAVLLAATSPERSPQLLADDGLIPEERDAVLAALAGPEAGPETLEGLGFGMAAYCEERVSAIGGVAVCALNRSASAFENLEYASIFASHAAIAAAALDHPPCAALATGYGAVPAAVDWMLDSVGYMELSSAIADEVALATGASVAAVLVWDSDRELLCPIPGAFGSDPEALPPAHAGQDWGSSAARVFATGQPYMSNRAEADPGVLQDFVEAYGFERLMTLPVTVGRRRVGVLQVANKPTDFTLDDLQAAAALSSRIAIGVEVARTRTGLVRHQRLEEVFCAMAIDIASGRDLHEFLGEAMDRLCAIVHGSLVALIPFEGDPILRRRRRDTGVQLEETLLTQAKTATSLRVYGVGSRRAVEPGWSVVHVPVMLNGEQVATVSVMRRGGDFFSAEECRAFSRLANLIALGWSTETYQRHLADSARVAERQRVADELHDHVAQLLFGARISLDSALEAGDISRVAQEAVGRGRDLLLRADDAIRQIMAQNSAPSDEPLPERLEATIVGVEEEFARPVTLEISEEATEASATLSRSARKLVCRAVREALVNSIKHAGPCQLSVRVGVTRRNRILVTISDSGIGVADRRGDGYGTAALRRTVRQHGGVLRVAETATGGTKVAVSLPL